MVALLAHDDVVHSGGHRRTGWGRCRGTVTRRISTRRGRSLRRHSYEGCRLLHAAFPRRPESSERDERVEAVAGGKALGSLAEQPLDLIH